MRLVQFLGSAGERCVGPVGSDGDTLEPLAGVGSVYELAQRSLEEGVALVELVAALPKQEAVDYNAALAEKRHDSSRDDHQVSRGAVSVLRMVAKRG